MGVTTQEFYFIDQGGKLSGFGSVIRWCRRLHRSVGRFDFVHFICICLV